MDGHYMYVYFTPRGGELYINIYIQHKWCVAWIRDHAIMCA